jgi:hypothetical protein
LADNYIMKRTFMDITDSSGGVSANVTRRYDSTGSVNGTSYMTPNTVTSSATNSAVAREVHYIEIIPPVNANGDYEDLREVWLRLDNQEWQHYINLSGYGHSLMTPEGEHIWGGKSFRVYLGMPLWEAAIRRQKNMPLFAICPKFARQLGVSVHSVYGITGTFRIRVVGYEYSPAALADLAKSWTDDFNVQSERRRVEGKEALADTFIRPGPIALDTWTALPGGVGQGQIKINPYWRFAYNAAATQVQASFVLSDMPEVGGASGNVEDGFQDLALPFGIAGSRNAFLLRRFGVRPVPLAPGQTGYVAGVNTGGTNLVRAGWKVNGTDLPTEEGGLNGFYVTPLVNDLVFGALPPYVNLPNVYYPIPKFSGELLILGDNAAPFIAAGGTPIATDAVVVAYTGVLVERG